MDNEPGTKAILTTGYTDREALVSAAREHKIQFLQKPYPLAKLFQVVRATLDDVELAEAG